MASVTITGPITATSGQQLIYSGVVTPDDWSKLIWPGDLSAPAGASIKNPRRGMGIYVDGKLARSMELDMANGYWFAAIKIIEGGPHTVRVVWQKPPPETVSMESPLPLQIRDISNPALIAQEGSFNTNRSSQYGNIIVFVYSGGWICRMDTSTQTVAHFLVPSSIRQIAGVVLTSPTDIWVLGKSLETYIPGDTASVPPVVIVDNYTITATSLTFNSRHKLEFDTTWDVNWGWNTDFQHPVGLTRLQNGSVVAFWAENKWADSESHWDLPRPIWMKSYGAFYFNHISSSGVVSPTYEVIVTGAYNRGTGALEQHPDGHIWAFYKPDAAGDISSVCLIEDSSEIRLSVTNIFPAFNGEQDGEFAVHGEFPPFSAIRDDSRNLLLLSFPGQRPLISVGAPGWYTAQPVIMLIPAGTRSDGLNYIKCPVYGPRETRVATNIINGDIWTAFYKFNETIPQSWTLCITKYDEATATWSNPTMVGTPNTWFSVWQLGPMVIPGIGWALFTYSETNPQFLLVTP